MLRANACDKKTGKIALASEFPRLTFRYAFLNHTHMAEKKLNARPGDLFLDRYLPGASEAEREEAYENLRGLIALLVRIDERLVREERERTDSRER